MIPSGLKDKRIGLDNPGAAVPDGDGGYTEGWAPLTPAEVFARIAPATGADTERIAGGTMLTTRTHLLTIDYHPGVTTATRITYQDYHANKARTFQVSAVRNPDEAYRELELVAEETTAA